MVYISRSIVVHVFGAYFGLAVSKMYGKPTNDEENKSMYHSDMFAMIGSLFLVKTPMGTLTKLIMFHSLCIQRRVRGETEILYFLMVKSYRFGFVAYCN